MKRIKQYFSSLKLNYKIALLTLAILVLPLAVLSSLFFENYKESRIREKVKNAEINFTQNYEQIQKNVEMCQMSTQVMMNSQNFWAYVQRFANGEKFKTEELLAFYHTEIKALEKIVNSNPYLYQVRVYVPYKNIPEMMPVLYRMSRMKRLSWGDGMPVSGTWQFDYEDDIFPNYSSTGKLHLVALVTEKSMDNGEKAMIEVSTKMDLLFPQMYSPTENEWTCFVDGNGNFHYDFNYKSRWSSCLDEILKKKPKDLDTIYYKEMLLQGEPVLVCFKPVKELSGTIFRVVSLKKEYASVRIFRNVFWSSFCVLTLLLLLLSDRMIRLVLKRFYDIMDAVHLVQKGELEVRIEEAGSDEFGELGIQINKMLDRISLLMEDNLKRELLVKDSEIRALQNQINAHFIYNVLESVKMMAEVEEKYAIADAVTALGKLLRYSMKWVSKNVTVSEEIDYIKNYLTLINLRFDYEIYLSLNIPDIIYKQEIPKMSLQPIIENAIYHGIEEIAEDTSIYMKGILCNGYCIIEITDSGKGMTEEEIANLQKKIQGEVETAGSSGNGIGLKNVQDRIKISFGDEYGISIASRKDCYTKVCVKIPLG
ncbi:sensor histidine kinase [Anaerocolumna xylanovorans]|uniref:Two-component system, sensor histidine kinase YesM n=1 Tax=Anaerocolumna xylanovorans DSM 12503 TaxID=1121345 RepID=A0A1M7YDT5_9FIRM|nr:histidine kinase [Anaerocolumna xylanovorans]SHO50802.1 two-component system, sensor histidine kinase YesM [Anaerocolumna xylanovorans DSM 12503]